MRRPLLELSGLCTRAQSAAEVDLPVLFQKADLRPRETFLGTIFLSTYESSILIEKYRHSKGYGKTREAPRGHEVLSTRG